MKLLEGINLKARLEKELSKLYNKVDSVAVVSIKPEENFEDYINITVDAIVLQISQYNEAILALSDAIRAANTSATITSRGNILSVVGAIQQAASMRRLHKLYEELASNQRRSRDTYRDNDLVNVATYDIGFFDAAAKSLSNEVEQLSASIDEVNQSTEIVFDLSQYLQ